MVPSDITHIVVHCSATTPSQECNATIIDRWHRQRGFFKIGYHYVLARDGTVEVGRKEHEPGAHAINYNTCSIGLCLVGGLNNKGKPENNFTQAQFRRLGMMITRLLLDYPKATVLGHRDLPNVAKDCPCFDVKAWWQEYVQLKLKEKA
jgi:N-acetylmuramoyl-L-alanine amidase